MIFFFNKNPETFRMVSHKKNKLTMMIFSLLLLFMKQFGSFLQYQLVKIEPCSNWM